MCTGDKLRTCTTTADHEILSLACTTNFITSAFSFCLTHRTITTMVPLIGLEPTRLMAPVPKTGVSTNSTIGAKKIPVAFDNWET